jgi:hypothetical protein
MPIQSAHELVSCIRAVDKPGHGHEQHLNARRFLWPAVAVTLTLLGGLLLFRLAAAGSQLGESASGELRNLEGNPLPDSDPVSLRFAVIDAAFGSRGPEWEVDPWKAYLAGRALGRAIALADPDVVVVFDLRLDYPEGEIPIHLRTAVEAELPWWATLVTVHRSTPRWAGRVGGSGVAPLLAGTVVLADGPVHVEAAALRRAAPGPQEAANVAQARASELSVAVAGGPTTQVRVDVYDGGTAEPVATDAFVFQRGGAGGLRSDDGRLGVHVAAGWSVTQSVTGLSWEQAGVRGLLLDVTRAR